MVATCAQTAAPQEAGFLSFACVRRKTYLAQRRLLPVQASESTSNRSGPPWDGENCHWSASHSGCNNAALGLQKRTALASNHYREIR
jgi:hypothetical protein